MNKRPILFLLGLVFTILAGYLSYKPSDLPIGSKYKLLEPVYIMGVYDSLNEKLISASTAKAYLHKHEYYEKSHVAFQDVIPESSIITIVNEYRGSWYLALYEESYVVSVEPDMSRGLEVILVLDRGMEGDGGGVNPAIFEIVE